MHRSVWHLPIAESLTCMLDWDAKLSGFFNCTVIPETGCFLYRTLQQTTALTDKVV